MTTQISFVIAVAAIALAIIKTKQDEIERLKRWNDSLGKANREIVKEREKLRLEYYKVKNELEVIKNKSEE